MGWAIDAVSCDLVDTRKMPANRQQFLCAVCGESDSRRHKCRFKYKQQKIVFSRCQTCGVAVGGGVEGCARPLLTLWQVDWVPAPTPIAIKENEITYQFNDDTVTVPATETEIEYRVKSVSCPEHITALGGNFDLTLAVCSCGVASRWISVSDNDR